MSLEIGATRFSAQLSSVVIVKDPIKWSKITYTREFLLSLAKLDTIKFPREVQLSISRGFEDASGILSQPVSNSDSICEKSVPQHSSLKVLDNVNHRLHRSDEPYRPPHHYKALPPSSRNSNDLLNNETSGSSDFTSQEKEEWERSRKGSDEDKSYADMIRLSKEDKWHFDQLNDSEKSSEVFLTPPASGNFYELQSTSDATTKNIIKWQKSVNYMDASQHLLSVFKEGIHYSESEACSNLNLGHPDRTPYFMESQKRIFPNFSSQDNCGNLKNSDFKAVYEKGCMKWQINDSSVSVHVSPGKITKNNVSEATVSAPHIEDKKLSLPTVDKCESAKVHCEGILSLHGVKQVVSVTMQQNPSGPDLQSQQELELNSLSMLDEKSNSGSELCLPDEDSLIRFDEPFLMPDEENGDVVDNSSFSPERNPIDADMFSPSSPCFMIEKLVESILNDESPPAPLLHDPKAHYKAELEGFCHSPGEQRSSAQLCPIQLSPGRSQQDHQSFQKKSINIDPYPSLARHFFLSNPISQPFTLTHDELRRFGHNVSHPMFQQMTNPDKVESQRAVMPHLPTYQLASCTRKLNSMQEFTLKYQEPSCQGFIRPNQDSQADRLNNQAMVSPVDMKLMPWHTYAGGF